jgi:hypothetical protein
MEGFTAKADKRKVLKMQSNEYNSVVEQDKITALQGDNATCFVCGKSGEHVQSQVDDKPITWCKACWQKYIGTLEKALTVCEPTVLLDVLEVFAKVRK